MPFTPFHMGPGMIIKVLLQGSFSILVFGWTQILMDIQPLIVLLSEKGKLHGFSHTYMGASLLAVISAVSGKYLTDYGLFLLSLTKKKNFIKTTWKVALISSFIGTFSHVILDSIMHGDMSPFYPFSFSNNLFEIISTSMLYKLCFFCGIIGLVIYYIIGLFYKKNNRGNIT